MSGNFLIFLSAIIFIKQIYIANKNGKKWVYSIYYVIQKRILQKYNKFTLIILVLFSLLDMVCSLYSFRLNKYRLYIGSYFSVKTNCLNFLKIIHIIKIKKVKYSKILQITVKASNRSLETSWYPISEILLLLHQERFTN